MMTEGIDFDLTYFPLKHLGYKAVIEATGELYAAMSYPKTLAVRLGISSKIDFGKIRELWEGITAAAKQHGYEELSLDLLPSVNGLNIGLSANGERRSLTEKRRMPAKSMDLICVSGSLGAAFMGMQILEREKQKFMKRKTDRSQPDLSDHRLLIGEYLKPELNPGYVAQLEEAEIIPSYGYFINRGLADAVKKLVRDSGLGAKVYVERLPFAGGTIDLGKQFIIQLWPAEQLSQAGRRFEGRTFMLQEKLLDRCGSADHSSLQPGYLISNPFHFLTGILIFLF